MRLDITRLAKMQPPAGRTAGRHYPVYAEAGLWHGLYCLRGWHA